MAINSAAKRRAFQSYAWAPQLPFPDGSFSSPDRFSIQGITAFYAAVPAVVIIVGDYYVAYSAREFAAVHVQSAFSAVPSVADFSATR